MVRWRNAAGPTPLPRPRRMTAFGASGYHAPMGAALRPASRLSAVVIVFAAVAFAGGGSCSDQPLGAPVRGGTPSGVQLRAPLPGEVEEFSFLVYGDRTAGQEAGLRVLERAVDLSNSLDSAFVMTVGDLVRYTVAFECYADDYASATALADSLKAEIKAEAANNSLVYYWDSSPGDDYIPLIDGYMEPVFVGFWD